MARPRKQEHEKTKNYSLSLNPNTAKEWDALLNKKGSGGKTLTYLINYNVELKDKLYDSLLSLRTKLETNKVLTKEDLDLFEFEVFNV